MSRYVALLRGINVGKNKRIGMADLRALCEAEGFENVRTLLQSGNIVLDSGLAAGTVESRLSAAIQKETGHEVAVVVRTGAQLAAVVKHDPYSAIADPLKYYSVSFLASKPKAGVLKTVDAGELEPERFELHGQELYMWMPEGQIKSRLPKVLTDKLLGTAATNRNWNTVLKLHEMTQE